MIQCLCEKNFLCGTFVTLIDNIKNFSFGKRSSHNVDSYIVATVMWSGFWHFHLGVVLWRMKMCEPEKLTKLGIGKITAVLCWLCSERRNENPQDADFLPKFGSVIYHHHSPTAFQRVWWKSSRRGNLIKLVGQGLTPFVLPLTPKNNNL